VWGGTRSQGGQRAEYCGWGGRKKTRLLGTEGGGWPASRKRRGKADKSVLKLPKGGEGKKKINMKFF